MKLLKYLFLIIFVKMSLVFSLDTAYPIGEGKKQIGIFQPYVNGFKKNVEISSQPLLFFIKPNIKIKKFKREFNGLALAYRYSFDYPTLLLKIIQKEGTGGFISEDPDIGKIPHLGLMQQEWLITKSFIKYTVTGKIGLSVSTAAIPGFGTLNQRHLIDYDLIYPRLSIHHHGIGANMGMDWDYVLSSKITFKTDVDLFLLPEEHPFLEHKFIMHYSFSEKFIFSSGYKFCYGYYPFNKDEGLWNLFPIMDLSIRWSK